jgi:hypothetical protein
MPRLTRPNPFPFDTIIVRDVRFDTSNIGATNSIDFLTKKSNFVFITFKSGLSAFLNDRLNRPAASQFDSLSERLLCYIRKFRMTEVDTSYLSSPKRFRQVQIRSAIDAFYYKQGRLYPAFKSDTIFLQSFPENKRRYHIIDSLILAFLEKARKIDKQAALNRRSFSEAYVDSMYRLRFNLPILTAKTLKPGVYTTVKEFLNNNPSIEEFQWKPDRDVNILYTRENNGNWVVTRREVFGFCDGKYMWFKVENSFFPAFQKGNAFVVIAPLYLKSKKTKGNTYTYITKEGPRTYGNVHVVDEKDKSVYQLDMDTGEFY